jgi:hypothetical protein
MNVSFCTKEKWDSGDNAKKEGSGDRYNRVALGEI